MSAQPVSLGRLIELLEAAKSDDTVQYDFCGLYPDTLNSYRGYYDHLALGHSESAGELTKVGMLLTELRSAVGRVYEGYKGGNYRMSLETPMWVADWGSSHSTAIVGVTVHTYGWVIIHTGYCDSWDGSAERAHRVLYEGLGFGNVR